MLFNGVCYNTSSACSSGVSGGVMSSKCGVPAPEAVHLPRLAHCWAEASPERDQGTAHFIFNGGSVGFPPVTLDKSLTAFYLNLTIF